MTFSSKLKPLDWNQSSSPASVSTLTALTDWIAAGNTGFAFANAFDDRGPNADFGVASLTARYSFADIYNQFRYNAVNPGSAVALDGPNSPMTSADLSKLGTSLARLVAPRGAVGSALTASAASSSMPDGVVDGFVSIDATAGDGSGANLLIALEALGLKAGSSYGAVVSGLLPVSQIGALRGVADLAFAGQDHAMTSAAALPAEAAKGMQAASIPTTLGINGSGITVGILSDSFNTSGNADTMATDIANGYLPANTQDILDFANGTDEGRAMAQIVHEIAPGSSILFETADNGEASFANNILDLASRGAKVIVDDVGYFDEPEYQEGVIAQAIDKVEAEGVVYLSAAGNDGVNGYEGAFHAGGAFTYNGVAYTANNFSTGGTALSNSLLPVNFTSGTDIFLMLQWSSPDSAASPGKGATSDLDLFLTDSSGNVIPVSGGGLFESTDHNIGGSPDELIEIIPGHNFTGYLRVGLDSGSAPADIKITALGDGYPVSFGSEASNTNNGTFYGHAAASGAIGVGAAYYADTPAYGQTPPLSESYSSGGPDYVYFDASGNLLPTPLKRSVSVTATDGADTSFFGNSDSDGDGFLNFFGTSEAAPSAAAVVALMLQANPSLTPTRVKGILQQSATPAVDPSTLVANPNTSGAGLVQANVAIRLARPTHYDFNGDGYSDILWRNSSTGADAIWDLTPSGGRTAVNPGTVATSSVVAGIGDFNNDGIADILWRNTTTGADSIWDMTASGGHTTVNPGTVSTAYVVAGVGDFNGDGIADILWRNTSTGADSLWDMTASGGRTAVNPGTVATAYVVAGVGDFNHDGVADILWRNTTTGADSIWDMNVSGGHTAVNPGTVATSYVVAGIGDFNGDGIADILWRNTATGADSIWDMTASGGHTAVNPGTVATNYVVASVGDFNGDGISDILWRNTSTGADAIWDMNAAGGHTTVNPGTVATSWKVAT